jgi:hypothetical protein
MCFPFIRKKNNIIQNMARNIGFPILLSFYHVEFVTQPMQNLPVCSSTLKTWNFLRKWNKKYIRHGRHADAGFELRKKVYIFYTWQTQQNNKGGRSANKFRKSQFQKLNFFRFVEICGFGICRLLIIKICGFAICEQAHPRKLRICKPRNLRTFKKVFSPTSANFLMCDLRTGIPQNFSEFAELRFAE